MRADKNSNNVIPVLAPKTINPAGLPVKRLALGIPSDEKPCVALLSNGELLLTAFHIYRVRDGKDRLDRTEIILFRSGDGGITWSERQISDLAGLEPYLCVLSDGTILMTTHILTFDVRNQYGYTYSQLHRSIDGGQNWTTLSIGSNDLPGAPAKSWTHTSRNVLELADGSLILGVSEEKGKDYLWQSKDKGITWDKSLACEFEVPGKQDQLNPFLGEAVFWLAGSGDILGLFRVDVSLFKRKPDIENLQGDPRVLADQLEGVMVLRSSDGGRSWKADKELGSTFGEMYPSILRLRDGRLLLTFTVRALSSPLGVHAVFGRETTDGFVFDFEHDRLILDNKTPKDQISGGGFGPTVQLADGTLVSAYSYRGDDGKTHLEVARWRLDL